MVESRIKELSTIFKGLNEAQQANLPDFPYSDYQANFNRKLKEYLKEEFGDHIEFDREETFAYIQAHYQGVPIEINTYRGIIFTVENQDDVSVVEDFKEIFDEIMGSHVICSYNTCHNEDDKKIIYPTFEWSLNPEMRLLELTSYSMPGIYITDLEDYHTKSKIQNLGEKLFTIDGYKSLFKTGPYMNYRYKEHILKQIKKENPYLNIEVIYSWCFRSGEYLKLDPEITYQKIVSRKEYIDDGK